MVGVIKSNSRAIQQSLGLSSNEIYSMTYDLLKDMPFGGGLLDFGSGRGRLLDQLSGLKFDKMTGADLMGRPVELPAAINWIQADLNQQLPLEKESFDVIIAIEVIEHLENPRAMMRELYRLLRPGGQLIISTPNNESFRSLLSLIYRGHFVSFLERDYPAHITALTAMDLTRIMDENNFSNPEFYFTNKGLIPGLKGLTWQGISFSILNGKRFSDNIFAVAKKI